MYMEWFWQPDACRERLLMRKWNTNYLTLLRVTY